VRATAAWASRAIDLGHPGMTLKPIVLGPEQIPQVVEPEEAIRTPELAVLSALARQCFRRPPSTTWRR
jgi:hypothetical protein